MSYNLFAAFLFVSLLIAGCLQSNSNPAAATVSVSPSTQSPSPSSAVLPSASPGFEVKWHDSARFRAAYPASWSVSEGQGFVLFQSPQQSASDKVQENINVVVAPVEAQATLQTYVEAALSSSVESGAKLLDSADLSISGAPAVKITYVEQSKAGSLQYMQVFALKGGLAYILTYTATPETFSKFSAQAENAMKLFEIKSSQGATATPAPRTESSTAPELVRKWRVYSQSIFYDAGGSNFLKTPATTLLDLRADQTWSFGSSSGTWSVQAILEQDWAKWGVSSYGPKRKLVLNNWNGVGADGPIDETEGRVDFAWAIYRVGPPAVERPAQIQMKFGQTYS